MNQLAEIVRGDRKRLFSFLGRIPTQRVAPDEAQWILQELSKRSRRLNTLDRANDDRMIGGKLPVVRRKLFDVPIAPARLGRLDPPYFRRIAGAGHQSIRFAEGVFGNTRARQGDLGAILQQRASPYAAALAAPTATR